MRGGARAALRRALRRHREAAPRLAYAETLPAAGVGWARAASVSAFSISRASSSSWRCVCVVILFAVDGYVRPSRSFSVASSSVTLRAALRAGQTGCARRSASVRGSRSRTPRGWRRASCPLASLPAFSPPACLWFFPLASLHIRCSCSLFFGDRSDIRRARACALPRCAGFPSLPLPSALSPSIRVFAASRRLRYARVNGLRDGWWVNARDVAARSGGGADHHEGTGERRRTPGALRDECSGA